MSNAITSIQAAPPLVGSGEQSRLRQNTLQSKRKSLLASTVGNVLEWYEWSAYAVLAPFIAAVMFNSQDSASALLSTLAVFAVGFLMRPLGGMVFGRIADRRGRKFVLVTTMLMMATGSLVIALMPTYEAIGVWASLGLLLARMAQGFAHGGESATAYSYVSEIAPPYRRGMWGSVAFIAIFGGSVLAYTIGGVLTSTLEDSAVADWGWRIPFFIGAGLALFALYLRRSMEESEVFDHTTSSAQPEQRVSARALTKAILLMIAMVSGITAAHYTWTSYISTFAITQRGMDPNTAYWVLVGAQCIAIFALPVFGLISDHIGRRPMLLGFAVLMAILQIPLTAMITDRGWTLFVASVVALLIISIAASILSAAMSETFPTKLRSQGIGVAYSISVAVFGGTAPYLNQQMIAWEMGWMFNVYIVVLAIVSGIAAVRMRETRGNELHEIEVK